MKIEYPTCMVGELQPGTPFEGADDRGPLVLLDRTGFAVNALNVADDEHGPCDMVLTLQLHVVAARISDGAMVWLSRDTMVEPFPGARLVMR